MLDRLIREVVIADPALGSVYVLKADISDGFYIIALRPGDAPNLGLFSPLADNVEDLVSILLTLPMGCKIPSPILCMAMETVSDLANTALCCN